MRRSIAPRTRPVPWSRSRPRELARVDAGARFGIEHDAPFRGQGGVPRLADLLDRHTDIPVIVEIKGDDASVVPTVLGVIEDADSTDRVIIGGFSRRVLAEVRRLAPEIPTGAGREEVQHALRRSIFWLKPRPTGFRLFQVPYRLRGRQIMTRRFVRAARRMEFPVQAWIVDEPDDIRRLLDWGVTGITSDRPDVALEVVRTAAR